jgi:protein-S-isoprenylcysteine O-methyltransferase Ste14
MDFEFIIPVSFFYLVGYVIKLVSDNRLKRRILEKNAVDENLPYLFNKPLQPKFTSLKWGMVITAIGLAGTLGFLLPKTLVGSYRDEVVFSFMFLFAGIALIVHYFVLINEKNEA